MNFTAKAAKSAKDENELSRGILDAAFRVHSALGPGLLEGRRSFTARFGYRLDLLVEELVVVEIKSVDALAAIHQAQLLSYLKLSGKRLGLLMNFNVVRLKDGIKRLVNGL
jgi:hypothetical protein